METNRTDTEQKHAHEGRQKQTDDGRQETGQTNTRTDGKGERRQTRADRQTETKQSNIMKRVDVKHAQIAHLSHRDYIGKKENEKKECGPKHGLILAQKPKSRLRLRKQRGRM